MAKMLQSDIPFRPMPKSKNPKQDEDYGDTSFAQVKEIKTKNALDEFRKNDGKVRVLWVRSTHAPPPSVGNVVGQEFTRCAASTLPVPGSDYEMKPGRRLPKYYGASGSIDGQVFIFMNKRVVSVCAERGDTYMENGFEDQHDVLLVGITTDDIKMAVKKIQQKSYPPKARGGVQKKRKR